MLVLVAAAAAASAGVAGPAEYCLVCDTSVEVRMVALLGLNMATGYTDWVDQLEPFVDTTVERTGTAGMAAAAW